LRTGLNVRISSALARHFLKHPIDCADVEVNVFVQAGAKAVDEGDCADVQCCLRASAVMGIGEDLMRPPALDADDRVCC
jgi:hypothetical protein